MKSRAHRRAPRQLSLGVRRGPFREQDLGYLGAQQGVAGDACKIPLAVTDEWDSQATERSVHGIGGSAFSTSFSASRMAFRGARTLSRGWPESCLISGTWGPCTKPLKRLNRPKARPSEASPLPTLAASRSMFCLAQSR